MGPPESELDTRARQRLGTVLRGKYRIDRVLGIGGMAVVYAATHRNQKQFAVKMLHAELSIREGMCARFLREGYVANSVKHPGAVAVLDDDVAEDGAAFLVMELLEGDGVDRLCEDAGRRLPARVVLGIGHQLLDVLAAAHAKSIVHRDIKPANIFLTHDGTLKVLDFGIARLRDVAGGGAHATSTGMILGTPAFMAPEQALAKSNEIDGQTDLWAVGATLFTLLTGEIVHVGENPSQILVKAATERARPLASIASHVPPRIAEVIDRSLAFEKGARWPSAAAMRDAIGGVYLETFGERTSRAPLAALFPESDRVPSPTPMQETPASGGSSRLPGTVVEARVTPVVRGPGRIAGGTTAQPVSNKLSPSQRTPVPRSSLARTVATTGLALLLLLIGAGVFALKYTGGRGSTVTSATAPSASPVTATPAAPTPASSAHDVVVTPIAATPPAPAPTPTPTLTPPIAVTLPTGNHRPGNARPSPSPTPAASALAAPSKSAAPALAPPAPAATPACRVVTYFDADGNKRFKQECQ